MQRPSHCLRRGNLLRESVVGLTLLAIASVLRWGFLASFLSKPILIGFIAGLALEVLVSQVRQMLGTPAHESAGFFRELADLVTRVPEAFGLLCIIPLTVPLVAAFSQIRKAIQTWV